ncbi:hypothetical protein [Candidatus Parabeggiatoa sp. HSG14]|uniref:hypothetical protein n=1 Tax=Candidatus Parabeggiatoa sp. HSG14 TaxID=3055593 RepID=UPI0025A7EC14|nr:hypothetical protein [Thiotrichales bacterium HSG14]
MNTINSNINYEFYYLLRLEIAKNDYPWQEPRSIAAVEPSQLTQEGITIDNDKRLFRSDTFASPSWNHGESLPPEPLENWSQNLRSSWEKVQRCYIDHFAKQGINASQSQSFCTQALIGVALLIRDSDLESCTITLPLRGTGNSTANQVAFEPNMWLLQVIHTSFEKEPLEQITTPAIFAHFQPQFQKIQQNNHWQLRLDLHIPQLAPMDISENIADFNFAPNPVFAVYGLAHGDYVGDGEWLQHLQGFLLEDEPALLVRVLPRLLMHEWQFTRMDLAAIFIRKHLQAHSTLCNQTKLPCLSNHQLSEGLQVIAGLEADTTLLLSQLRHAIKTLEIHRNNTEKWLWRTRQYRSKWNVVWQHENEAPLLDNFDADRQRLHNHVTYVEGDLTYLESIRRRWHLHFEGRQLVWSERLGSLSNILVFFVAVGVASLTTMGLNNLPQHDNGSFLSPLINFFKHLQTEQPVIADFIILLSQPVIYWLLVLVLLLLIFWYLGETILRKMRCSYVWRWGIVAMLLLPAFWFIGKATMKLL